MKSMTPLQRATVQMSVGIAVLTAITEIVYVILALAIPSLSYQWKFTVGNIFMAGIMGLNFYLMARGIYHAVDMGDEEYAQRQIRLSHTVRSIVFVLALVSCFLFGYGLGPHSEFRYEPGIAACITVVYPQLTVFALRMFGKFGTDEPGTAGGTAADGGDTAGGGDTPAHDDGTTGHGVSDGGILPQAPTAPAEDERDETDGGAAVPPTVAGGGEKA